MGSYALGLSVSVGYLADVLRGDPEGSTEVSNCFARLNEALLAAGCERHDEPVELETALRFSCDMWGYSGLHHLRRVAAYAAFRLATPSPIADGAAEDPVLKRYYAGDAATWSDLSGVSFPSRQSPAISAPHSS